jgi:hypothetical protein
MLEVYKDHKYGEEVYVSKTAEEGRKNGCLCINGCKRLANNKRWQENLIKNFIKAGSASDEKSAWELLKQTIITVARDWFEMPKKERERELRNLEEKTPCPIATANFAVCLTTGIANGVSRCPYFLPDERVKIIDKPNTDAN